MRKQYHFWPTENGFDAWDVDRLVQLSGDLPVVEVPLDSIDEVESVYWFNSEGELPTVAKIIEHVRLIQEVDLSYPIILGFDGRVLDGMHRIARAILDDHTTIKAVRFPAPLEPDYRNCQPDDLPYEEESD